MAAGASTKGTAGRGNRQRVELGVASLQLLPQLTQATAASIGVVAKQQLFRDEHGTRVGSVDVRFEGVDALRSLARSSKLATTSSRSAYEQVCETYQY